jgi:DNA-binding MarR family transcriptional regulator
MRLYIISLIVFCQAISQEKPIKTFFSKDTNLLYTFFGDHITKKELHGDAEQNIKLNPVPKDYPDYDPIWYQNQLHLLSARGGLLYRIENDTTIRLDNSFQHRKQFQSNDFVYRDTLFRYGGYGFWRANNFFTYFDHSTKEWEYYPIKSFTMPDEAYDGKAFLLNHKFYVLGGQTVSKTNGLAAEKSKQIWVFDFKSKEWNNGGKMGLDIGPYKTTQKDSLFYLIGHPSNTSGDLIVDLQNNMVKIFDHTLISANTDQKSPAFFKGDTLYYTSEQTLHKSLAFRDIFVNQSSQDRMFLNEITLFWNITYLGIAGVSLFLLAYGSVLWQRRKLPRLVKGGVRHNLTFYPLSIEEQQVLNYLRQNITALTEELMPIFSKQNRSYSQTHKLKADAIDNINNLLNSLVGKELIKKKKDPKDKRQLVYYYKRNILH